MPFATAAIYAFWLVFAFGGMSAALGLSAQFDPLAILLVLLGYWSMTAFLLTAKPEGPERIRKALALTIAVRILLSGIPCIAADFAAAVVAIGWVSDSSDAIFDGFPTDFLTTLLVGAIQGIGGVIQFVVLFAMFNLLGRSKVDQPDRCRKCGYDIRASGEFGRCPECGTPIGLEIV